MNPLDERIRTRIATYATTDLAAPLEDTITGVLDECERLDAHHDPRTDAITRNIRNVIAAELGIIPGDTTTPQALKPADPEPSQSGLSNDLPPELWIGKINHQWPLYLWANPTQAQHWLTQPTNPATNYHHTKRLWHITIGHATELALTSPVEQQLIPANKPAHPTPTTTPHRSPRAVQLIRPNNQPKSAQPPMEEPMSDNTPTEGSQNRRLTDRAGETPEQAQARARESIARAAATGNKTAAKMHKLNQKDGKQTEPEGRQGRKK